jgi:SAM-dependent methyltransferase
VVADVTGRPPVPTELRGLRTAVSYRRFLLDAHLQWASPLMAGKVVDLGGKRVRRRGQFVPPADGQSHWIVINIDNAVSPHIVSDAAAVPLADAWADCVVCTEVLEHLSDPAACVRESLRLLRPAGYLIVSVPFLYPVHADPGDYQRWTPHGLRVLLQPFARVEILAMGGTLGTLASLVELGVQPFRASGLPLRTVARCAREIARVMQNLDIRLGNANAHPVDRGLTTGYFVVAIK